MDMAMDMTKIGNFFSKHTSKLFSGHNIRNLFSHSDFKNPITVDLHSHLLPGIDDGVRTLEESIKIIKNFTL